jgi:hypothetical protein
MNSGEWRWTEECGWENDNQGMSEWSPHAELRLAH